MRTELTLVKCAFDFLHKEIHEVSSGGASLFLCSLLRLGFFTHITHACFVEVCLISYMINNKLCSNTTTHMQADRYKTTEETKRVMCSPLAFSLF